MYRRKREREECICELELLTAASAYTDAYASDSDGEVIEEAVRRAFVIRYFASSIVEDPRELRRGRHDNYFLDMNPTHFEEVMRAGREDLLQISRRLHFPVDQH